MSDLPIYPRGDLDSGSKLAGLLGSYWQDSFPDKDVLVGIMRAREVMFEQAHIDRSEAVSLAARSTSPVYHTELWKPIKLLKSSANDTTINRLTYGANKALYGQVGVMPYDRIFNYGESIMGGNNTVIPLDSNIKHIRLLCNSVTNPTLILVAGVDFLITSDNMLTLALNVFTDPRVQSMNVYTSTGDLDTEATLWAFSCDIDMQYMWKHYGFVVGALSSSSEVYNTFVNAMWDSHVAGSSVDSFRKMLAAAFDAPIAVGDETIELILTGRSVQVVTDKRVYRVPLTATLIVNVGDVLKPGDFLVDTVDILDLSRSDDGLKLHSTPGTVIPLTNAIKNDWTTIQLQPSGVSQADPGSNPESVVPKSEFESRPIYTAGSYLVPVDAGDDPKFAGLPACYGLSRAAAPHARNDTMTMQFTGIAAHTYLELSFDLYIFGDWAGNDGAAVWSLAVDGNTLLETNFSNISGSNQAYPDAIGVGDHPRYTSAVEPTIEHPVWSCVVSGVEGDPIQPSRYRLTFRVPHNEPTALIEFSASGITAGRYAINPVSTSLSVGPVLKKYDEVADPAEGYNSINDPTTPDLAEAPEVTPENIALWSYETGTVYARQTFLLAYPSRNPGMLYPAMWWGVYNITVNAISDIRLPLANIPADRRVIPDIPGLALDQKYITGAYYSSLFFANEEVPLEYVGPDAEGFIQVKFDVSGFPADVEQFWADVHARGVAQCRTLANYLDLREQPIDQPLPGDLPTTINPLLFLLRHIMQHNLIVAKVKRAAEGVSALDPAILNVLRFTLPPHIAYIIFTEVSAPAELYEYVGSELHSGVGPSPDLMALTNGVDLTEQAPTAIAVDGVLI